MKRITTSMAVTALIAALGIVTTPAANAINCNAFNQGTAKAYHEKMAKGNGLVKIGMSCHMMP